MQEHPPPRALADVVDAFWSRTIVTPSSERRHRVLPDGCVDVIVILSGRPRVTVVGAMTRAIVVPEAASEIVAVRLRPGAARVFIDAPADAWTDARVDADDLGIASAPLIEALLAEEDTMARVRRLAEALAAGRRRGPDALVERATLALAAVAPPNVAALADRLGVTRQALTRRVRQAVGVGPKELQRSLRIQRAAAALRAGRRDHAALACELGFFDQAHFIHEMRALAGVTPGEYARELAGSNSTIVGVEGGPHSAAEHPP